MIELACKTCIFHFNKKSLEDNTLPPWTILAKGKSYYVNHLDSNVKWSTRETPDKSTKGAIKFKNVLLRIDDNNCAEIFELTSKDAVRLRAKENGYVRILIISHEMVTEFFENVGIKFTTLKKVRGRCGSKFFVCDIKDKNDITAMTLGLPLDSFRLLQENEIYYAAYEDDAILQQLQSEFDEESEYDEGEEDD